MNTTMMCDAISWPGAFSLNDPFLPPVFYFIYLVYLIVIIVYYAWCIIHTTFHSLTRGRFFISPFSMFSYVRIWFPASIVYNNVPGYLPIDRYI